MARRWRNSFPPSISYLWGPQKGRMERPFGGRGRRGSNSLPASREWPEVHSQEPCRTSDQTCLRHRWRQRVRSSTDKKRTSRLGCPLEAGAGDEARTRYRHPANGLKSIRRNPAGPQIKRASGTGGGSEFVLLQMKRGHPDLDVLLKLERATRLELATSTLARWRSTR